jgi:hypothetical protein
MANTYRGAMPMATATLTFFSTRGNSEPYDGVFWLEQVRTATPARAFKALSDCT